MKIWWSALFDTVTMISMKKVKWVSDNAFWFNFGVKPDFRVHSLEFKTWFQQKDNVTHCERKFFSGFSWHFPASLSIARRISSNSTKWSRMAVSARPPPYIFHWTRLHILKSSTSRSFDHGSWLVDFCFTTYYHLCFSGSFLGEMWLPWLSPSTYSGREPLVWG